MKWTLWSNHVGFSLCCHGERINPRSLNTKNPTPAESVCFKSDSERLWPSQNLSASMKTGSNGQETQRLLHLPARGDQEVASLEVALIGRDQCHCRKSAARVAAARLRLLSRNVSAPPQGRQSLPGSTENWLLSSLEPPVTWARNTASEWQ